MTSLQTSRRFLATLAARRAARRAALLLPLGAALFAGSPAVRAANVTHVLTGTSSPISTATFTPALPAGGVAGDLIQYGTPTTAYTLTLDVNTTIGGVKVTNSGPLTITGGVLTLDGTGISGTAATGNIFGNANTAFLGIAGTTGNLTVNSAISLATDADFGSTTNGSTLTIGGAVTNDSSTAKNLNFRANSTTVISNTGAIGASGGSIAISNLGTSTGAVTLSGNLGPSVTTVTQNSATSALTLSGLNAHTGGTTLTAGTLTATNAAATNQFLALGTGTLTLNGGTLNLRANGSANGASIVTGDGTTGNNVVVGGNTTISTNNAGGATTSGTFVFNNLSIGANTLIVTPQTNGFGVRFAGTTTLTGSPTFNVAGGLTTTLSGAVGESGGSFGLTKTGSSTLALSAANTYTGATTINTGTLTLNGAGSILTTSAITVAGTSARLLLDNSGTNNANRIVGNVSLSLGGELSLTGNSGASPVEAFGALGIGPGSALVTATAFSGQSATLSATSLARTANGTALVRGSSLGQAATFVGKIALGTTPTLVGAGGAGTGTGTTRNLGIVPWLAGTTSATNTAGTDFVTYDTTLGSLRPLVAAEYSPTITGATAGDNVKTVAASETAIPTQTLNALFLAPTAAQTITGAGGGANVLTISSGALASGVAGGLVGSAAFNSTISGFDSVAFGNDEAVVTVAQTGGIITLNSPASVTNGGGLTKAGVGTLVLGASNLFTGSTTVNQGTLQIGNGGATGDLGANTANIVLNGGNLVVNRSGTLTLPNNISGTGALTQATTAGTIVLSGSNTYAGATTVLAGGTLQAQANANNTTAGASTALSANSAITLGVGATLQLRADASTTFTAASTTANAAATNIDVNNVTAGMGNTLRLNGAFNLVGNASGVTPSTLNVTGANGYTLALGAVNLGVNNFQTINATTANVTVDSVTQATNDARLQFTGSGNITNLGGTTRAANRTITYTNQSTGTVTFNGAASVPGGAGGVNVFANSGTTVFNNATPVNGLFLGAGALVGSAGNGTTRAASATAASVLLGGTNASATQVGNNGGITFALNFAADNLNTAQLTVGGQNTSGTNTYSGVITLGTDAASNRDLNLVAAGGGTVAFTNNLVSNGGTDAVTVNSPYTVNGATVTPTGTVRLSGVNTYTGGTTVNGGTLLVNNIAGSGTGSGPVTVGDAAGTLTGTLGGSGTIVLGALAANVVTVNSGSTLSPGNSPGLLTITAAVAGGTTAGTATLNLQGGSLFSAEVNGTIPGTLYDQVVLNGTGASLFLAGNLALTLGGGFTPANTDTFTLINNTSAGTLTGAFANAPFGSGTFSASGFTFDVGMGDGNDVVLLNATVVPEPGTWAMMVGGGLLLVGLQGRRRRQVS